MRQADDGGLGHSGEGVEQQFHLFGIDVEAAGDDQVFLAPDDVQIAVGIEQAQIAGDEKAVTPQVFAGFSGHVPVAFEDVGAAHLDHADLTLRQGGAIFGDFHLHPRQRQADGACPPVTDVGVRGGHVGFCHAVTLQYPLAGAGLKAAVGVGEQGGRARDEQPHMGGAGMGKAGITQQAGVEGGNPHHHACAGHVVQDGIGVKAGQKDHRGPGQQRNIGGHEQAVDVKDRQGMQQHVSGGELPQGGQRRGIRQKVVLRQHRPFGAACGARGVKQGGKIIGAAGGRDEVVRCGLGQTARAICIQRKPHAARRRAAGQSGFSRGVADQNARGGIGQKIRDLGIGIAGVQR